MPDIRRKNSSPPYLLYLVVALALLAGAALLLPVYRDYHKKRTELTELKRQLGEKQTENAELTRQAGALQNSPEAIEKVAREKFKLCREGETVFEYPELRAKPAPENRPAAEMP